jgi:hypothetical protein
MKFQKHLIVIPTEDNGTANVTATIAMGTGLGYVQCDCGGYSVIAQNLGNQGISDNCCKDERHAQLFIEELCKITDWTQNGDVIMSVIATKHAFADGGIEKRIQRAFDDAETKYAKEVAA